MCADVNEVKTLNCDKQDNNYEDDNEANIEINFEQKRFWNLPFIRQVVVMLCPVCWFFSCGIAIGTPTVMIPQLVARNEFQLNKEMQSWLYSVHGLSALPAVIILPYLSQKYGRRPIMFSFCLCLIISWILEYFAQSFVLFIVAESMQGLAMGTIVSIGVFMVGEYPNPKYRGAFLVFKSASFVWGVWVANAIGTFTDSKINCLVAAAASITSFIVIIVSPESPVWLAGKGKYKECKESFMWVRGSSKNAIREFREMFDHYSNCGLKDTNQSLSNTLYHKIREVMQSREFYLPFSLSIVCFCLYHFTGKIAVTMYALVIIEEITHDKAFSYKAMLIIDGISVIGMYLGCYLGHKLKRRILILSTTLAGILIMLILSLLLLLSDQNLCKMSNIVMLALLMLYSLAISMGPMAVSTSIFVEIVPHKHKSFITTMASIVCFGSHTVLVKSNPFLMKTIGLGGIFLLYAFMTSLAWLFLYYFLPETKDKTLADIEKYLIKQKPNTKISVDGKSSFSVP